MRRSSFAVVGDLEREVGTLVRSNPRPGPLPVGPVRSYDQKCEPIGPSAAREATGRMPL
jgi:hypothetical protein